MTNYKYIEVTPIANAIGAEISGVDISIDLARTSHFGNKTGFTRIFSHFFP
jgi:hypothetical protein